MQTFFKRFRLLSLSANWSNEAALFLCLDAIGARSLPVTFDFALPTREARVAFDIAGRSGFGARGGSGHVREPMRIKRRW